MVNPHTFEWSDNHSKGVYLSTLMQEGREEDFQQEEGLLHSGETASFPLWFRTSPAWPRCLQWGNACSLPVSGQVRETIQRATFSVQGTHWAL